MIRNKLRRLFALAAVICLAAASGSALAVEPLDADTPCSLTLSCVYGGKPVEGMALRLYRAAAVSPSGSYVLTDAFAGSGISLDALNDAAQHRAAAGALARFVRENELSPDAETQTGADGNALFRALSTGMYLLSADTLSVSGGEYTCDAALIALPGMDEDEDSWLYERAIFPKLSFIAAKPSPAPGDLPDTGMLQWPVPALALAGLTLLCVGMRLCRRKDDA